MQKSAFNLLLIIMVVNVRMPPPPQKKKDLKRQFVLVDTTNIFENIIYYGMNNIINIDVE